MMMSMVVDCTEMNFTEKVFMVMIVFLAVFGGVCFICCLTGELTFNQSFYHSFTQAVCLDDCKYLHDVEIQCKGNKLVRIHDLGFFVPNTKNLNITIDGEKICER